MSDSLPTFSTQLDPGPSFADLLRQVAPHQLPGANVTHPATDAVPHGTTVVAIRSASGVVMAGDRRATAGYTIASRRIEKVFPADDFSGVSIAGAAGAGGPMGEPFPGGRRPHEKGRRGARSPAGKGEQPGPPVRADPPAGRAGV